MPTQPKPRHDHQTLKFPKGFLWGTATSAFQVEGNNINADWWSWEQKAQPPSKRSGKAANEYALFEKDFDLAKELGQNTHRLSIEWSRIEPTEGQINLEEIEHYKKVLKALKDQGFSVMLTLHHFTNPVWFAQKGGWESAEAVDYFEKYIKMVVPEFKDYVDFWITINEPSIYVFMGFLLGAWPPNKKSKWSTLKVYNNLVQAHKKSYRIIHDLVPKAQVGIANSVSSFENFHHHSLLEDIVEWGLDLGTNHLFYQLSGMDTHDFLGVNYYFNRYISLNGEAILPSIVDVSQIKQDISDQGWEIYPPGIFNALVDLSDYHKPIYVTENGIASTNDDRRVRFLLNYLNEIYHAIKVGVDVRGYYHWSLIDNYEWIDGYDARFGLIEVDFKNQRRTPRPSAYVYKEIIENNGIPHKLLRLLGHGMHHKIKRGHIVTT
ncbi:glycoside hydrolase family 1 protein [Candidatus Daviesbacteria bacterium]|nr:glycoside hydrolase family 1 protein [Candidatus Daviesbacteria bacterium]